MAINVFVAFYLILIQILDLISLFNTRKMSNLFVMNLFIVIEILKIYPPVSIKGYLSLIKCFLSLNKQLRKHCQQSEFATCNLSNQFLKNELVSV